MLKEIVSENELDEKWIYLMLLSIDLGIEPGEIKEFFSKHLESEGKFCERG